MSSVTTDRPDDSEPRLDPRDLDLIAPFVAWMATQGLAEHVRRSHREAVEAFLCWIRREGGPPDGRRRRYEEQVVRDHPERWAASRDALDCYGNWHAVCRLTVGVEER